MMNIFEGHIAEFALFCLLDHFRELIRNVLALSLAFAVYGALIEGLTRDYIIFLLVLVHIIEAPLFEQSTVL